MNMEEKNSREAWWQTHVKKRAAALQAEFDACPPRGETYACRSEERMLPSADGVHLQTLLYTPVGPKSYPVLVQRSCYPGQAPLYTVYARELTRRG